MDCLAADGHVYEGVPATQVAEWAGHSVEVLLKIYAKCLDGQDARARRQVMRALGHREES